MIVPRLVRELQVAIDTTDLAEALELANLVQDSAHWIELGTPLLLTEGVRAVPLFQTRCPHTLLLADTKIVDAGYQEAAAAFERGANGVTVLGISDDQTISGCVEAARSTHGLVMADMMHVPDVVTRAAQLEALGVDVICLHTAWDRRRHGIEVLADLRELRGRVRVCLAVAGGVTLLNCREVLDAGAETLVIGGGVTSQADPRAAAAAIRAVLEEAR